MTLQASAISWCINQLNRISIRFAAATHRATDVRGESSPTSPEMVLNIAMQSAMKNGRLNLDPAD